MGSGEAGAVSPFTTWLPARSDQSCDVVIEFAGRGARSLSAEIGIFAHALSARGLEVLTHTRPLGRGTGRSVLRLRVASGRIHSAGHGCDVLVYLDDGVPDFDSFGLQRGSILLWEPPGRHRVELPDGLIVYPIPLWQLAAPFGAYAGTARAALGALAYLLGLPEETVRASRSASLDMRPFDAGLEFARANLVKHDLYSLPAMQAATAPLLLGMQQAIKLGLASGYCECGDACGRAFDTSPVRWLTEHLEAANHIVSLLQSDRHPTVQAYRGPNGSLLVLQGGDEHTLSSCLGDRSAYAVLLAPDVGGLLRLLSSGRRNCRPHEHGVVGVLIDDGLGDSWQTLGSDAVAALLAQDEPPAAKAGTPASDPWVESDSEPDAAVGYVAWGAAQGVVRDAVELSRNFGLRVSALYPSVIHPFPTADLDAFARTVDRVVVVECDRTGRHAERVGRLCRFRPAVVMPEPGKALTPMDLFLKEGLGA